MQTAYSEAATFEELGHDTNLLIRTQSATDLSILPDESIDYIFTDPPHGDRIPYLELSAIWMAWLRMEADYEEEIVISDAKYRHKDIEDYRLRLAQAFREMHRVLKKGGFMSVAFNSWRDEAWRAFMESCCDTGFEIVDVVPTRYSANSVMQDSRKGGLRGDFTVTFRKSIHRVRSYNLRDVLAKIKDNPTIVPYRTL
ncbi:MAG: hypothetical protein RMM08_02190 [Armatimonadota bacterium]|nr:hypothetical protein [Armatimonadota bacterium]